MARKNLVHCHLLASPQIYMLSLTTREQMLILTVLAAVLLGTAVKHWRDARREAASQAASALPATP